MKYAMKSLWNQLTLSNKNFNILQPMRLDPEATCHASTRPPFGVPDFSEETQSVRAVFLCMLHTPSSTKTPP